MALLMRVHGEPLFPLAMAPSDLFEHYKNRSAPCSVALRDVFHPPVGHAHGPAGSSSKAMNNLE